MEFKKELPRALVVCEGLVQCALDHAEVFGGACRELPALGEVRRVARETGNVNGHLVDIVFADPVESMRKLAAPGATESPLLPELLIHQVVAKPNLRDDELLEMIAWGLVHPPSVYKSILAELTDTLRARLPGIVAAHRPGRRDSRSPSAKSPLNVLVDCVHAVRDVRADNMIEANRWWSDELGAAGVNLAVGVCESAHHVGLRGLFIDMTGFSRPVSPIVEAWLRAHCRSLAIIQYTLFDGSGRCDEDYVDVDRVLNISNLPLGQENTRAMAKHHAHVFDAANTHFSWRGTLLLDFPFSTTTVESPKYWADILALLRFVDLRMVEVDPRFGYVAGPGDNQAWRSAAIRLLHARNAPRIAPNLFIHLVICTHPRDVDRFEDLNFGITSRELIKFCRENKSATSYRNGNFTPFVNAMTHFERLNTTAKLIKHVYRNRGGEYELVYENSLAQALGAPRHRELLGDTIDCHTALGVSRAEIDHYVEFTELCVYDFE